MINLKENKLVQKMMKRKRLTIIISVLVIAVIVVAILLSRRSLAKTDTVQQTAMARKGTISTSVTGSGSLTSSSRTKFTSKTVGTVTAVNFKEGDRVKQGDLLIEIESTDAENNFESSQSALEQAQDTQNDNVKDLNGLTMTAPFDGQITSLSAEAGSTKTKNDTILTLVDTSKLKLQLTFTGTGIKDITVGKSATVYIQDFMDTVTGKVTYVSSKPYTTANGGEIYNVDIEVSNPGSLQEDMIASAEIDTSSGVVSSIENAAFQYINKAFLKSAGGTVKEVRVRQNQQVSKGELMVVLENEDLVRTVEDGAIKLKSLESQLGTAKEKLDNCMIYSPIDGVIVDQAINVGDSVEAGTALTVVTDDKSMEFIIPVDELDIAKLKVGQEASITVDALSETTRKPLTGTVSHVAQEGTSSNGVTTYSVTVSVSAADGLKGGMNANAEIYISKKENVLTVPLEAIQRVGGKTYVMVKGDAQKIEEMKKNGTYIDLFSTPGSTGNNGGNTGFSNSGNSSGNRNKGTNGSSSGTSSRNGNSSSTSTARTNGTSSGSTRNTTAALSKYKEYYADAIPTLVEVGLNDTSNIEIVSGLNEGDIVILPPTTTSSSTTTQTQQSGINIMGGAVQGGGMPAGGNVPGGGFGRQ